jgi:hypothetical protein
MVATGTESQPENCRLPQAPSSMPSNPEDARQYLDTYVNKYQISIPALDTKGTG